MNDEALTKKLTEIENHFPDICNELNFLVDKDREAKKVIERNKNRL